MRSAIVIVHLKLDRYGCADAVVLIGAIAVTVDHLTALVVDRGHAQGVRGLDRRVRGVLRVGEGGVARLLAPGARGVQLMLQTLAGLLLKLLKLLQFLLVPESVALLTWTRVSTHTKEEGWLYEMLSNYAIWILLYVLQNVTGKLLSLKVRVIFRIHISIDVYER